jgi:argonaute-like protein implicated in RNA metabolism and viral defense
VGTISLLSYNKERKDTVDNMFEKKITKTAKVTIKNLSIADGRIVDEDGIKKDLVKVILASFDEGDSFDFTVTSKSDDSQILQEDGDVGEAE